MGFGSLGIFLGVVWLASVSLSAAATTSPPTSPTNSSTTTTSQSANTTSQTLWPDYANSGETTARHYVYFTRIPFTYYEYKTIVIELYDNGYVTFGSTYEEAQPPPPAEWPTDPKILGVYWSKLIPNSFQVNSSMFVKYDGIRLTNVTYQSSLIKYVKKTIAEPDFEPLLIIAATWVNIRPKGIDNETATFQVLLATDSQVTYAIRGYESVWENPELDNLTYYAATYSQGFGERPKIVIPGSVAGPEVILLGTKKPNKDPYICAEKTQAIMSRLNSSLNTLPPCPCYEVQASEDPQFKMSGASPSCYQSTTGGSLYQLCCYNMYGHLINYTNEMGVPVPTDSSDHSLQEAFEKCCVDASGLCEWFQDNIYLTQCANYTPAFNKSELPSFYNRLDDVVYNRTTNINVGLSVKNKTGVTYSLMTTFNSSHGLSISFSGMYFLEWEIASRLDALRKASYPQLLVVYATDSNNMSTSFAPLYKLCLCQQETQCDTTSLTVAISINKYGLNTFFGPESYQRGNVNIFTCNCKGKGTGRYCEKPINACDNCLVQNTPVCSSNPQGYCPSCPSGYQRNGTQCQAISSAPRGGNNGVSGNKTVSGYLLVALSSITCYILWIQNLLTTPM